MDWRLEALKTNAAGVRAALEGARDKWTETTPQDHASEPLDEQLEQMRGDVADHHNEKREPFVKRLTKYIAEKSRSLGPGHTAIKSQMDRCIDAAVGLTKGKTCNFHVSLSGHYLPDHPACLDERLAVQIDDCR